MPQNMIVISDYQIMTQIYESANKEVYRALGETDGQRVILKVLKQDSMNSLLINKNMN
jgi:serine/threonine protein kinase